MTKIIKTGKEARTLLKEGVEKLENVVGSTLGAAGRSAILDNLFDFPMITADGITVAEQVILDDPFQRIGASIVKGVSREANNNAGDGSSTSVVLANAMLQNDHLVEGLSPALVKRGMLRAEKDVIAFLDKHTHKAETKEILAQIATVSARGDKELGDKIAEAFMHIGKEGRVIVDENRESRETVVEYITGYHLDTGLIAEIFATNKKKEGCEYDNVAVFGIDKDITDSKKLSSFLGRYIDSGAGSFPLVLVAPFFSEECALLLATNNARHAGTFIPITAQEYGANRVKLLKDLMFFLGGEPCLSEEGNNMDIFEFENLGYARNFVATAKMSVFLRNDLDEAESKEAVDLQRKEFDTKLQEYKKLIEAAEDSSYFKEVRLGKLSGRVAKIKVGSSSAVESNESLDRIDDAKNATRGAYLHGFIVGGGVALLRAHKELSKPKKRFSTLAEQKGYEVVIQALTAPITRILRNAYGDEDIDTIRDIIHKISKRKNFGYGYDVSVLEYKDLLKAGIIDPVLVTKSAIYAAVSVVSNIIVSNAVIAHVGEEYVPKDGYND